MLVLGFRPVRKKFHIWENQESIFCNFFFKWWFFDAIQKFKILEVVTEGTGFIGCCAGEVAKGQILVYPMVTATYLQLDSDVEGGTGMCWSTGK